jgi:hypothetical protein
LPIIPGSTSNLSVNEQQVVVVAIATAAKRKEEDAAAQAAAATAHREQEALVAARKTLDEAQACERAAALTWEKEKVITRHLEQ